MKVGPVVPAWMFDQKWKTMNNYLNGNRWKNKKILLKRVILLKIIFG